MSSKRRSCRTKKGVDYSEHCKTKHDNSKYGSDDDFENDFEPPSKKSKVNSQEIKNENQKLNNEKHTPNERISVSDKLYKRDVEKALQMSLDRCQSSSQEQTGESSADESAWKTKEDKVIGGDGDYQPEQEGDSVNRDDDDYDSDEDGKSSNSDSSENNMKNPACGLKRASNIKKTSPKTKVKPPTVNKKDNTINKPTSKVKTKEIQKESLKMNPSQNCPPTSRKSIPPSVKSPINAVANRSSSLGLGGVVIKNPGPPIRVGLSRNRKVKKPLHPNISGTNIL